MNATLTIQPDGTTTCLYTELINLHKLGTLQIERASNIDFNNQTQLWEVRTDKVLYSSKSRTACIKWEHNHL